MNWTNFLVFLTLAYLTYYGLNLLYDLLMGRKPSSPKMKDDTLIFEEDIQPEIITYTPNDIPERTVPQDEPIASIILPKTSKGTTGNVFSTGAIGLKELFSLAKNNLIEYTSAIPY
jgi:hypothetical protein